MIAINPIGPRSTPTGYLLIQLIVNSTIGLNPADPAWPMHICARLFRIRLDGSVEKTLCLTPDLSGNRYDRSNCRRTQMALYDRDDRISRPQFLTDYGFDQGTDKRARKKGLPWPPHRVIGGRVFYSRTLVEDWFSQQQPGVDEQVCEEDA